MKVVLASRNRGKLRELQALLAGSGLELSPLSDWPQVGELEEDGQTFLDNARSKARATAWLTGRPALADDSGLAVEALGGRPGVHSARYAGSGASDRDNWLKLLEEMKDVAPEARRAAFVCVLVLAWPDGRELVAEGRLEGFIAEQPAGHGGFGYDPVFYLPQLQATVAQLEAETKNRLSHRARAAGRLKELLAAGGQKG